MAKATISPAQFWGRNATRTEFWAYIRVALPGWEPWLTLRAGEIQWRTDEEVTLMPEAEIVDRLKELALQYVEALGPRAKYFDPYMQFRPAFPLADPMSATALDPESDDIAALNRQPLTLAGLRAAGVMPSSALIGLVGALGRRQQLRKWGATGQPRRKWALKLVARDLLPFCDEKTGRVLPPALESDPAFNVDEAAAVPISVALCALVAILISLPSRDEMLHADPHCDPEVLELPFSRFSDTIRDLEKLRGCRSAFFRAVE